MSDIEVNFNNQELKWKLYIAAKAISTFMQIEFIKKNKFAIATLDLENKIFIVYLLFVTIFHKIYSLRGAQIVSLKVDVAPTTIVLKYLDFADKFSLELTLELPEHKKINKYAINFIDGKQPP